MEDHTKRAIEKLKIIKEMSNNPDTSQVCKVLIEWLGTQDKEEELGFVSNSKDKSNK